MMTSLHQGDEEREFVGLCWSVLMVPGGGVPPPTGGKSAAAEVIPGERPAEQDEDVARRLGFEVERRELSQEMGCIEVRKSVLSLSLTHTHFGGRDKTEHSRAD